MSNPRLLTKDSLKVILCLTLSSVTLTVQSPNSNAANWGWSKGRPSVTTDLNWSYASRHKPASAVALKPKGYFKPFRVCLL
jgi:hypothetical protein